MTKKRLTPIPRNLDAWSDDLSEKVVRKLREDRRQRWHRAFQVVMLLGALSGLLTLVAALWELLG